ncbi:MAG: PQQ-binding-like beta-propeller repeat protein [Anaerolineales bacterium]|nr:PQQ-binding-like beta-propeller repeat protein [Anaerolineales bacterium]
MNQNRNRSSALVGLLVLAILVPLLSGCSGQRLAATSWPGLVVKDNLAYIAFNQQILAVDPAAQRTEWEYTPTDAKSTFYAAPSITDGTMVLGGYDSVLYGIDRENLNVKWNFHLASGRYIGSPMLSDSTVFAATAGNELFALNLEELEKLGAVEKADDARRKAERSAIRWQFTADQGIWASPLVTEDIVYITALDHNVYALNIQNGNVIWTTELPGAMANTPTLSPDGKMLFTGNFDYNFYALDAATGEKIWQVQSENWIWAQPVLAGEKIFFGDLGGFMYVVNAGTGELLWKEQIADAIRGEPVYDSENGRVYIAGRKVANPGNISTRGFVMALDAETYNTIWEQATDEAIYTSPALYSNPDGSGDLLLVTPSQGEVLMQTINAETGVLQWRFTPNPDED